VSTHIRHTERTEIDEAVSTTTLVDVLRRNAALHEKAPAIHWRQGDDWKFLTWAGYRQVALEAAAGLMTLGVDSGDVVAIQAGNRPEHLIASLMTRPRHLTIAVGSIPATSAPSIPTDSCQSWVERRSLTGLSQAGGP
jgi:long-subunit acyl-CoA synthetase (AMP-forming)